MCRKAVSIAVLLIFCSAYCLCQEDRDPTKTATRYLLAEEYYPAPADKLALLQKSGGSIFPLPVVKRKGRPDYDVEIRLDKGAGSYYKLGEAISFELVPRKDCYLLVYDIQPDGVINILFPNSASDPRGHVEAGRTYTIPTASQPMLEVRRPLGLEFIQVIATADPLPLSELHLTTTDSDLFSYGPSGDSFLFVNALRRELASKPSKKWAGKEVFFIVSDRYSDPTPEQIRSYKSTGYTGYRDVIPVERWEFQEYGIVWGDTLSHIALRFYGSAAPSYYLKLAYDNGIVNPDRIYAGDKIRIYEIPEK